MTFGRARQDEVTGELGRGSFIRSVLYIQTAQTPGPRLVTRLDVVEGVVNSRTEDVADARIGKENERGLDYGEQQACIRTRGSSREIRKGKEKKRSNESRREEADGKKRTSQRWAREKRRRDEVK